MKRLSMRTLIVTTNVAAVHQWIAEILDKTTLTEEEVGEYTGDRKTHQTRDRVHLPDPHMEKG